MAWLYKNLLRPMLFESDAETSHERILGLLARLSQCPTCMSAVGTALGAAALRLPVKVFGLEFPNPVGLAAGLDKNAVALPLWPAFGFGFIEIGTVTAQPQAGHPRPRLWRLERDLALLNRLGFPNDGADRVADRLAQFRARQLWPAIPVGINIGKSATVALAEATADYLRCFERLRELGDFFVVNVSSPNTPQLRRLQERARLEELLGALQAANRQQKPLLLKISPDLTLAALDEIIEICQQHGLAGIVATNTTTAVSNLRSSLSHLPPGGLSGAPLRARSTDFVRHIAQRTGGALPVIGVGGVFGGADAAEKICAGASLVELYTGFVYEGPRMMRPLLESLRVELALRGFADVESARKACLQAAARGV